ncbi:MAG: hypothetical protein V3V20_07525 [Algisphaera sp.]
MTHRSLAVLILLNVGLLVALGLTVLSPTPVQAQFGASPSYTMISGAVSGRSGQAAVYVIDLQSSKVAPIFYNASNKKFEYFKGQVVSEDMKRLNERR